MVYCLNPYCPKPQNPDSTHFCTNCGTKLQPLLRGRYRIVSPLGEGGFGKTYLAEDEDRRRARCVVKQFAPAPGLQSNPEVFNKAIALFHQEAERLLQLEEHSQIPTLYAYFEESNSLYLVQQFVKGQTLMQEWQQQGNFSEAKIRTLLEDLLPVLDFVHQRGVIHRDIKPENIIRRESDGKLVLIDFGVAKQGTKTLLTKQGTTVGTPGYAPIEQAMRGVAYPASDLYSLAVTCLRLMAGCWLKEDGADELYNDLEGRWLWRECLQKATAITPQIGDILDKLLKDYPKERYQSARDVLAALNSQSLPPASFATAKVSPSLKPFNFEVVTADARGKEINRRRHEAEVFSEDLGGIVILEMVSIPGGSFLMGSPDGEGSNEERPQHSVTVAPFFMGKYPVTQAQWQAVMGRNFSTFKGEKRPVETISWNEAVEFCNQLYEKTGRNYRLPSEAEWEYACRAGTTTPFHFGETITANLANYDGNSTYALEPKGIYRQQTTDVGSFPPNAFGLYDMHGNVWEWCQDVWHENYKGAPSDGSAWELGGNKERRVQRGGSWLGTASNCRSANRTWNSTSIRSGNLGFRVALSSL